MSEPEGGASAADRVRARYRSYSLDPRRHRQWSAANPGNKAIRAELLESALQIAGVDLRPAHVLDIGCGGGWWLSALAKSGAVEQRLHGIDLIEARVISARARLPAADIRCEDATALPWETGTMDLVLLFTVLSSVDRAAAGSILSEARRVAAPGGRILVYEPRVPTPANRSTAWVRRSHLTPHLGPPQRSISLTLAPPLARRLGRATGALYPVLVRVPWLRTHRLWSFADGARAAG